MGHGGVAGAVKGFGVEIGVVECAVYFAGLDLPEGDLFFDIVDDHQKVFAFLCMGAVFIGDGDDCAVVFRWEGYGEA
jgi:hypothetical protein